MSSFLLLASVVEVAECKKNDWNYKKTINCYTYHRIGRWLFVSIEFIILLFLLLLFLVSLVMKSGQKHRIVEKRNFFDFDGFVILAFYLPLALGFCMLWRTVFYHFHLTFCLRLIEKEQEIILTPSGKSSTW